MTEFDRGFRQLTDEKREKYSNEADRSKKIRDLFGHMEKISGNPAGTELNEYFDEEEVKICNQFLLQAEETGWVRSDPISMQACWVRKIPSGEKVPAWTSRLRTAKSGLTKALFFPQIGKEYRGYSFAKLGISPSQRVALCSDGLLRSLRGPELNESMAIGWGKLPDKSKLTPALSPGYTHIEYGNNLRETLQEKIPASYLERIDS